MDYGVIGSDAKTSDEIRIKSIEEIIRSLSLAIDDLRLEDVDPQIDYHLRRSYHYYRLATDSALESALEDVFSVIDMDGNRFEAYLLGALILFAMKRWDQSLQMFELSIRFNSNLFQLLANKLIFLKFKILTEKGFDEEISFKNAMTFRFLNECIQKMDNSRDESDVYVEELFSLKNKVPIHSINNRKKSESNSPETFESFVSKLFSSGDQQMIRSKNIQSKPIANSTVVSPNRMLATEDDNQSLDLEFKEIQKSEAEHEEELCRNDSIQTWIDTNFRSDTVSKLCSFDETEESEKKSVPKANSHISDNGSITSGHLAFDFKHRQPATNLLKLRGVYIGNLKTHCDHKILKDLFKAYGTIVEMYQPSGADYAFIHYKIHESATNMLNEWKGRHIDQCKDNKPLVVRFTASQEQMKKFNSMSYSDYKKRCNESHECERWRSGQICPYDRDCPFKHLYINRAVDTLPDKRKANWRCI